MSRAKDFLSIDNIVKGFQTLPALTAALQLRNQTKVENLFLPQDHKGKVQLKLFELLGVLNEKNNIEKACKIVFENITCFFPGHYSEPNTLSTLADSQNHPYAIPAKTLLQELQGYYTREIRSKPQQFEPTKYEAIKKVFEIKENSIEQKNYGTPNTNTLDTLTHDLELVQAVNEATFLKRLDDQLKLLKKYKEALYGFETEQSVKTGEESSQIKDYISSMFEVIKSIHTSFKMADSVGYIDNDTKLKAKESLTVHIQLRVLLDEFPELSDIISDLMDEFNINLANNLSDESINKIERKKRTAKLMINLGLLSNPGIEIKNYEENNRYGRESEIVAEGAFRSDTGKGL